MADVHAFNRLYVRLLALDAIFAISALLVFAQVPIAVATTHEKNKEQKGQRPDPKSKLIDSISRPLRTYSRSSIISKVSHHKI